MAVAHYIRIVDYVYVFPQLVGADGGIRQQDGLLLLSVGQDDADVEAAFQKSFRIVETGADVQSSGVQVYVGRKIIQLCRISEKPVFAQADGYLPGNAVPLLHQHGEPLVVCYIEVRVQMVVFVDGCQCDGLHAAAYIASGIHQVTAYGAVEGGTDGAVAQIGACRVQGCFRIAHCSLRGCHVGLCLQHLYTAYSIAFHGLLHTCVVVLGVFQVGAGSVEFCFCLPHIVLIDCRFDDKKYLSLAYPAAGSVSDGL